MWKEFNKIDLDKKGEIKLDEIYASKKILMTEWGHAIMKEIDVNNDEVITFAEFFIGMYNYLAASQEVVQKVSSHSKFGVSRAIFCSGTITFPGQFTCGVKLHCLPHY